MPSPNGFTKGNVSTMKNALIKAKASKIPMLKVLMKLKKTSIGPSLPSPIETLHKESVGLHIPGH